MGDIKEWVETLKKIPIMLFGLFLYATGVVATLHANLGLAPWEVFHMGIVNYTPITLGQASQIAGLIILFISYFMGAIPGLASIFNMFFIGFFIDIVNNIGLFKTPALFINKFLLLFLGIYIIGWGSYFYLMVQLGAGPRDGLMESLVKKLKKPVWMVRGTIELTVLLIGYLLGGPVGVGTLITALTIGFSVQMAFKFGRYDSATTVHENMIETIKRLKTIKEETIEE